MAGDKFRIGVEAAYDPSQPPGNETVPGEDMLGSLISALSGGAGGTYASGMEGGDMNPDMINGLLGGGDFLTGYGLLKAEATDPQHPKAYLSYVLLDEDMHVVKENSGVLQVGAQHAGAWGPLETDGEVTVSKNGYMVMFTSNEDMVRKVGYDNLLVTYSRGRLLEEQHYYPHGLVAVDGSHNPLANRYLYQGKELQSEAGLQLYDFHARQYDPQIGRFWGIDPMDEFPSGYTGMGNDPANLTDPDGMQTVRTPSEAPAPSAGYSSPGTYGDGGFVDGPVDFDEIGISRWADHGLQGLILLGGQGQASTPTNGNGRANASANPLDGIIVHANRPDWQRRAWDDIANELNSYYAKFGNFDNYAWYSWNGPLARAIVPDFISVGGGFNAIALVGPVTGIDFNWTLRGPQASWKPSISATVGGGGGYSISATVNITGTRPC